MYSKYSICHTSINNLDLYIYFGIKHAMCDSLL